jgi:toxoflavin biosynthesis protein ToxD
MPNTSNRPLQVFLCHSSNDKPAVRALYQKLHAEPWIQPWLDEEELYPGQDWNMEIERAIEETDAILVCLSNNSITKEGYVQREVRIALDYADYKPEGTLFIIPVRLEECKPPKRLLRWQYADYFEGQRERGIQRLFVSLQRRAESLGLKIEFAPAGRISNPTPFSTPEQSQAKSLTYKTPAQKPIEQKKPVIEKPKPAPFPQISTNQKYTKNGFLVEVIRDIEFVRVPAGKFLMGSKNDHKLAYDDEKPQHTVDIHYDYWMARYPVTNGQYNDYVKARGIKHPVADWQKKKDHPVVYVSWNDAMAYCQWLNNLLKGELPAGLVLRLPTEAEWEKAARGTDGREYPWGNQFDNNKCNTSEGGKGSTTPVGVYSPQGDSPYGCADMSGNVWEWTHSFKKEYPYNANDGRENEKTSGSRVLRGGSFVGSGKAAYCAYRCVDLTLFDHLGFRVEASPVQRLSRKL